MFGTVYNDKAQRVNVADHFQHMISYYQVLPRDRPASYKYILDYPTQNRRTWKTPSIGIT